MKYFIDMDKIYLATIFEFFDSRDIFNILN